MSVRKPQEWPAEFEKNVKEYGFVAAYLSPDPAGRHDSPGMNTSYWDPIYAKCQEGDMPVFIHGTNCLDPRIAHIPGNYQLGFVIETFLADLAGRGCEAVRPDDPLHDPGFVATITEAYRTAPSVYP